MDEAAIIAVLNQIMLSLNQILPAILLVGGTIGQIFNIIIFSKRSQRSNPVSIYFLSSTIANIFVLYFGVLLRYLQDLFNINIVNDITAVCRIRSFIMYLSLSLSNWYILLATIDRYLISSRDNNRRQLSSVKNALRIIFITTIICILSYVHILILYTIQTTPITPTRSQNFCYPQRGPYRIFSDAQLLIQFSCLPPLFMCIFIIFIIRNIRRSHARLANVVVAEHQERMKKRDLQLSKMLVLQVIITILCALPLALSQLTTTATMNTTKTALRLTIENLFSQLGRHLAFFNCSISFYLYTLSGTQFRLECRQILNRCTLFFCRKGYFEQRRVGVDCELTPGQAPDSVAKVRPIGVNQGSTLDNTTK